MRGLKSSSLQGLGALLLFSSLFAGLDGVRICSTYCDGDDSSQIANQVRNATIVNVSDRIITVLISDSSDAAYARLDNGVVGDNLYIERSFDAGQSWQEVGLRQVERGQTSVSTPIYNLDNLQAGMSGMGAMRACARARTTGVNLCTAFVRSTYLAETPHAAAATGLMQFYQDDGHWTTVGWWNAANCLTATIGYVKLAGGVAYADIIEDAYEKNMGAWWGNYNSDALDDIAWWTLAWIDAWDLNGQQKFLDTAISNAELIAEYRDDVCGDGVWWNIYSTYKNAITNELAIKVAAKLANRLPTEGQRSKYLAQAVEMWDWFINRSKMVNGEWLVNDGLNNCENNRDTTWTYNQGVILGAAVELFNSTGDDKYIRDARKIADAVIASSLLSPQGILKEPTNSPDGNNNSFKGVFMRNLGELNRAIAGRPYQAYIERQLESNMQNNRNANNLYGFYWAGPLDHVDAARQQSVLDLFNAAL